MQERYSNFVHVSSESITSLLKNYNDSIVVSSCRKIDHGRANSNYVVYTNLGKFMLRICRSMATYNNELAVDRELCSSIKRPRLLYARIYDDTPYLLYQFIESQPLSHEKRISDDVVREVSLLCAKVHNTPLDKVNDVEKLDLPPFRTWYDHFLENPNTIMRLDSDTHKAIKRLVKNSSDELECIDSTHCVIHNDFRMDNMIIDSQKAVYIIDWESITVNHRITDIGQFFRYKGSFSDKQIKLFEDTYNLYAENPLPNDWMRLAKLRDLVNLLQLVSSDKELPNYYETLKKLIHETLDYFKDKM